MANNNRQRYLERRKNKPPIPRKIVVNKKEEDKDMDKFNILMVITFFMACLYLIGVFNQLDLSLLNFFQFYFLFLGAGFLVSIKRYRKYLDMSIYEYILFNFMSFAPLLICTTFIANASVTTDEYVERYKIKTFDHSEIKTIYFLENNQYEDKEYLRVIGQGDEAEVSGNSYYNIYFKVGLLGIRTIEKKVVE